MINVAFWMDLDPKKRLEKIKPENELVKTTTISGFPVPVANDYDAIEEAKAVISMVQENTDELVDTEVCFVNLLIKPFPFFFFWIFE